MNSALSPREIQSLIRSGSSVQQVAAQAGVEPSDLQGFAGPVLAEREFVAATAQTARIRRREEGGAPRRLGELIADRLQQRGLNAERIEWDSWRQPDRLWRVVAKLEDEAGTREAEFVYDTKGRFSVAHNADARWMIGEQLPGASKEDENTVDFQDELALLRATSEFPTPEDAPGDDVPTPEVMHDDFEDTSELDALYDMLSGISEDSVRIYTGLEEDVVVIDKTPPTPQAVEKRADEEHTEETAQDSLIADDVLPTPPPPKPKKKTTRRRKGRAQVPTWDEIMFGGPATK